MTENNSRLQKNILPPIVQRFHNMCELTINDIPVKVKKFSDEYYHIMLTRSLEFMKRIEKDERAFLIKWYESRNDNPLMMSLQQIALMADVI